MGVHASGGATGSGLKTSLTIGLHIFNNQPAMMARAGAPVAALPIQPATATLNTVSLLAGAPHPNAGKLFLDFLLSGEGQTVVAGGDYVPADPNTPPKDPSLRPDGVKLRAVYFSPEELEAGIAKWGGIYKDLFR